jgi:hypothetical protein
VGVAAVQALALMVVRRHGPCGRLIRVASVADVSVPGPPASEGLRRQIAGEPWLEAGDRQAVALGALRWTMSRVSRIGIATGRDADALLAAATRGEGLSCAGMARLYAGVLAAAGVRCRLIALCRNILDKDDTHTAVEVHTGRTWVLLDPTFHVAYAGEHGRLLSAQEVRERVFAGRRADVQVRFLGEVAYPARHDAYYMDVLQCFDNGFVLREGSPRRILNLPPLSYWFGPRLYYEKLPKESVSHLECAGAFYRASMLLLPLGLVAAVAATVVAW